MTTVLFSEIMKNPTPLPQKCRYQNRSFEARFIRIYYLTKLIIILTVVTTNRLLMKKRLYIC